MVVQVAGGHGVHHTFVGVGANHFVTHQVGTAQQLVTLLKEDERADAGDRRRQGARKHHVGGNALADTARHRGILQAEDLRQHHGVLVLEQHAYLLHHFLPDAVHHTGNLHGAHLTGTLLKGFQFRQAQETQSAGHPLLLQAIGQERSEKVVVTGEIHDEHLAGELGRGEDVHVLQRQGRFLERAQRQQPHAGTVVQAHAGLGKEFHDALGRLLDALEGTGEEMQGVLPGADDGGLLPRFLQGDAGQHTGEAAADDYGIESHRPNTSL